MSQTRQQRGLRTNKFVISFQCDLIFSIFCYRGGRYLYIIQNSTVTVPEIKYGVGRMFRQTFYPTKPTNVENKQTYEHVSTLLLLYFKRLTSPVNTEDTLQITQVKIKQMNSS